MEIEVKVLDISVEDTRKALIAKGCEYLGKEFQRNMMFDYPDQRLYKTMDGSYIRLRQVIHFETKEVTQLLTFKKTLSREKYKIADEIESSFGSLEGMTTFLKALDLEHQRTDEKIRESYIWKGIRFEIDEWAGLPPYLEVEAESESDVAKGLALLGYTLAESTSKNLQEVLDMYKIKESSLCFDAMGRNIEEEIEAEQNDERS